MISFVCAVYKIQTLVDGGIRITLDLPENSSEVAKTLMDWRNLPLKATVEEDVFIPRTDREDLDRILDDQR